MIRLCMRVAIESPPMARAAPWLVLLFVSVMAGGSFAMIKYMNSFVSPAEVLLLRFLPTSIVSIIILLVFYREAVKGITPKYWAYFMGREFLAVIGFHFILIYAEMALPAGASAIIVGTWPVMTIFIAYPILGEEITIKKVGGAVLAFTGATLVVILAAREEASLHNITAAEWIKHSLILLIAPASAAVVTVISRWYLNLGSESKRTDSFLYVLICRSLSGFYAILTYAIFTPDEPIMISLGNVPTLFWVIVLVISLYSSLFGFWLYNWGLQRIEASSVASFTYIQTLFALLIAWWFLAEPLNMVKVIGAVIIVAGVLITNMDQWIGGKKITIMPVSPAET